MAETLGPEPSNSRVTGFGRFLSLFRGFGANFMRGTLAYTLVVAFVAALWKLIEDRVPPDNEQLVTYMLGQLSGMAIMVLGFYFVTSKSSSDKNEMLRDMMRDARGSGDDTDDYRPTYTGLPELPEGPEYEHIK